MVVGSLVALSGCSSAGSGGGQAPSADPDVAAPSASPAAAAPLTCADLVGGSDVDIALASPSAPMDFASLLSYPTPYDFASTAAGGIRCAWLADGSTGTYSRIIGEPGVPWLDVLDAKPRQPSAPPGSAFWCMIQDSGSETASSDRRRTKSSRSSPLPPRRCSRPSQARLQHSSTGRGRRPFRWSFSRGLLELSQVSGSCQRARSGDRR